jgi:hypothetical protein
MIAKLLSSNVKQRDEIVKMLHDHSPRRDPASLLEPDDFPMGLTDGLNAMGISSDRLFTVMTLVIPQDAEVYSSEASEEPVGAALVDDEVPQREEQPAGSADFPPPKTEVDAPKRASDDSGNQSVSKRRGRALYADEPFDMFSEGGKAPVGAGKLPM